MAQNPRLLQTLINLIQTPSAPSYLLNKNFDVEKFAKLLLGDVEDKRSFITAITREQAEQLGKTNLQFSSTRHESRINTLYRLIGLPNDLALDDNFNLLNSNGNKISKKDELQKELVQREFEQLQLTFKQFLTANNAQELNAKLNSTQAQGIQLISELFDPKKINTNRLFPVVQFSKIQNIVDAKNKISPPFASNEERFINNTLTQPPFIESVITIRLLKQSGGEKINTQGAVEDVILQSLGFALSELVKQYNKNQTDAENHIKDGIATIRSKVLGVNSSLVKQADLDANNRENDNINTEIDIREKYQQTQASLYEAMITLLPTENDIIPTGINVNDVPFQSRNIKNNALTNSFISILTSNLDALRRTIDENKKVMKKRQLTQDKLTAEIGSIIGDISGISIAEIIIVISALFVIDEEDLIGLIPASRFEQLINTTSNTSSSSNSINDSGQATQTQKQINIFDILQQFRNTRTNTTKAVMILQDVVKAIYDAFVKELGRIHMNV